MGALLDKYIREFLVSMAKEIQQLAGVCQDLGTFPSKKNSMDETGSHPCNGVDGACNHSDRMKCTIFPL